MQVNSQIAIEEAHICLIINRKYENFEKKIKFSEKFLN